MVRTKFALILNFHIMAHKDACHTLSNVCFEIHEDIGTDSADVEGIFTKGSEVQHMSCGGPSPFFSDCLLAWD